MDWHRWHEGYREGGPLRGRLRIVQDQLRLALGLAPWTVSRPARAMPQPRTLTQAPRELRAGQCLFRFADEQALIDPGRVDPGRAN